MSTGNGLRSLSRGRALLAGLLLIAAVGVTAGVFFALRESPNGNKAASMLQPEDLGAVEEEEPFAVYTGEGASSSERVDVRQYLDVRLFSYLRPGWFGLTFDSIRPIYEPQFVSAEAADLDDKAYVLGLALNGDARGYPIGILARREMVNDVVGGVPVLVTW